ncbi:hypothetical protein GGI03_004450 [Coemansia sp. RSA 2337]|nr:hypothetical protein LPJ71_002690 [Coemansia sp. S17]KAJ2052086.1 hypothetical protein H4S04_001559 [Coemansia sp. S16]KAJ2106375.1 hypothetical protein GGI16_001956 [Coemansia sp. S142-1]KAJ2462467.1 hypothetical protein GGI03_004450 [Coemansia sp. RSA 2337]
MSIRTPSANNDGGGSAIKRMFHKCNEFRSTPAAVLIVSTMAVFSDTVVYGLIVPFLPDILQNKLGMSSSANGILFGTFGLGVLIGAPISAYISDRWNMRKWPMVIGLVGLGATSVLFALADAFWELVVARLAQGISSGITWAVGLAMIADVYSGEGIGKAMGVAFSGFTIGYLGGPVLGGVIYGAGGNHAIAIFVGAIAVVDLVFRLLLVEPKNMQAVQSSRASELADVDPTQVEKQIQSTTSAEASSTPIEEVSLPITADNEIGDMNSGVQTHITCLPAARTIEGATDANPAPLERRTTMWDLLKEWPILACCLATITVTGASGSFEPTLPIHMDEEYGSSPAIIGVVFIALVVPSMITGILVGRFTDDERVLNYLAPYGRFAFMIVGSLLAAIAVACVGATRNIAGLVVNLAVVGFLCGTAAVPILSTMGVHVYRMGGDAYAKVYALFNIAYSIGVIVIPTVLPPVMNAVGFAATMGVVSALLVFGAIVLTIQPTRMLRKYGRSAFVGDNARTFL